MRRVLALIPLCLCLFLALPFVSPPVADAGGSGRRKANNTVMGLPAEAKQNSNTNPNSYLISRVQYTLSYNSSTGTANWVCWNLNSDWTGSADRENSSFVIDPKLVGIKPPLTKVASSQYDNSGFNRGHLCPSADRSKTANDNQATFYTTNIIPQSPKNNQETWKALETYCRKLADQGKELFIVAGPLGKGGVGDEGAKSTIGPAKVQVPASVWKIILVQPGGQRDPSLVRVGANTRVIAVSMANNTTVSGTNWGKYRISGDKLQQQTNLKFFSNVNAATLRSLFANADTGPTN